MDKLMRLGAFFMPTGHHVTGWLHPESQADAQVNLQHYVEMAQLAERGKFDMIFLADSPASREGHVEAVSRSAQYIAHFEPITLLTAMAMVTKHIGLVSTMSTSYNEPYNVARLFASLDHISGGRAGWNIVTGAQEHAALNFNREAHFEHEERYDRAREFTEVVLGLWDSWDDDAFLFDRESGRYFDPDKRHVLNHKGQHFQVRGPLNVPRPPQGHPVLVQAGSSPTGRAFASTYGEAIFTAHLTYGEAKEFYDDIKARAAARGRNPDHIKVLPGLSFIVGRTQEEAQEKFDAMLARVHPMVAREIVSFTLGGVDLSPYDMDGPLPELPEMNSGSIGSIRTTVKMARDNKLTIRQLGARLATARQRHHVTGTPERIADVMEEWFTSGACDGFNMLPPYMPGALRDFVELVIPELQRRGLFRTEYEGKTLRDNLGLPRPQSRYAKAATLSS